MHRLPDPENTDTISSMNPPKDVKEVRRFFGNVWLLYCTKNIHNSVKNALPLTEYCKRNPIFCELKNVKKVLKL